MAPIFFLIPKIKWKKQKEKCTKWGRDTNKFITLTRIYVELGQAKHGEKWND
jgi:hypothetical protein